MNTSYSLAQVEQFRRDAKRLARQDAISHSEALDKIAVSKGLKNWSLLSKHATAAEPVSRPFAQHSGALPAPTHDLPDPIDTRSRYYLHGDQDESNPALYYCARCDVFFEAEHFATHDSKGNSERYLSSLARWTRRDEEAPSSMRRPADAVNFLAASAIAANTAHEASRSAFNRWIETQKDRNDPIGDLASDIWSDRTFPVDANTRAEVQRYMESRRAAPEALKALKGAWKEFRARAA